MFIALSLVVLVSDCATMWAFDSNKKITCVGLSTGCSKEFWNIPYLHDIAKLYCEARGTREAGMAQLLFNGLAITTRGSIPDWNSVKTELHVLRKGQ